MAKEGTGASTARIPDTETKVEGMKIDNEFSDLSNDYTIQEFEFEKGNNYPSVKGRLKKNLIFWQETLSAISAILEIIDNGYKIPFYKTPKRASFCNNQSALKNKDFVEESISELLKCGSIIEAEKPPEVINPLSVSINSPRKKRLILDLRNVNTHVYKDKIKFQDWKCFEHYLEGKEGYLFKFDLKNGYHHIDIFEPHQKFLGFSWVFKGNIQVFVFTVLPFGLTSAPFIFTKVVRPLVKYWRFNSVKITCFLDDGIGIEYNYEEAKRKSEFVQETLAKSGFIPNIQKSTWKPCKILTWLGIDINLSSGTLKMTKSRIDNILNTISLILRKIFVSARILAKLAGQLISTKYVIGDILQIKTRFLYKSIEQSSSWDKTFNIGNYDDTADEILFWKFNLVKYNNKVINCYNIPLFHVHSDASNTGIACVFDVRGKKNICYRNLTELEKTFSSTWRELEAIRFSLLSGIKQFENKCIFWYTANFATQQIIKRGSNKTHIHLLALNIFNLTFHHNIHLEVFWVGREYNKEADKISKTIDFDDWYTTQHLINILEQRWGKISIDRFPSDINRKSKRFNSRYLCPETEGINTFSIDWSKEANLLVPPTYLIPRAIKHFLKSLTKSKAILIYPYWPSAPFWSLLASGQDTYFPFVKDVYLIENPAACIKLGDNKKINFRFTRLPRLFYCNFNDKITTKKKTKKETKKRKEHYLVTVDAISQGLQKIFPQVNKNLIDLFEFLPHVLANSRENNTNK